MGKMSFEEVEMKKMSIADEVLMKMQKVRQHMTRGLIFRYQYEERIEELLEYADEQCRLLEEKFQNCDCDVEDSQFFQNHGECQFCHLVG